MTVMRYHRRLVRNRWVDRLKIGKARAGNFAGTQPITCRLVGQPRLGEMICQCLRLGLGDVREGLPCLRREGGLGTSFGCRCFKIMDRAAHYRDKANRALRLAEAAWQPELKDRLRSLAKDYDEIAEDIETGATEIRHPELLDR
jgi:hypothetical protein